jgi:hypothetical protein
MANRPFLSRLLNFLRPHRGRQTSLPLRQRLLLEALEDRVTPSTLNIDILGNVTYTPDPGVNANLTLSAQNFSGGRFLQHTFADTAETITVTGPGAAKCTGSGTNSVTFTGTVSSIAVDTGNAHNTINIQETDASTQVLNKSGGQDVINVGASGSVQQIHGPVFVNNTTNNTTLNVDDSADFTGQTATLQGGSVVGLAPATISAQPSSLIGLNVFGGSGANTFTISQGGVSFSTLLVPGSGQNTINVVATGGPVTIESNNSSVGSDIVNVTFNHSAQNILGPLTLTQQPGTRSGSTALTVDDSSDGLGGKNVTISATALTGLTPAAIQYSSSELSSFTVDGGAGKNTFTINDPSTSPFTLNLGNGGSTVNIQATAGPVAINYPTQSSNAFVIVTVGNAGSVQGIVGQVTLTNTSGTSGFATLTVDDSADGAAHNATISATQISGLAPSAIVYTSAGLPSLTVKGGSGTDTFTIPSTLAFPNEEFLECGNGTNQVNILAATAAQVEVQGGTGTTVTVGSKAPALGGTLASIHNQIVIAGLNGDTGLPGVVVDDSGDTASQHFNVGANTIGETGKFSIATLVSSEALYTGSVGNIIDVNSTGSNRTLNLNLGKGGDTVNVFAYSVFPTDTIQGPLNISSGGAAYTLNYSDKDGLGTTDPAGQSYTLTSTKLTRTNEAAITYGQGATVNITGGSGSNTFTVSSVQTAHPVTITGGGGADTLLTNNGAHIINITGHNAGNFANITFSGIESLVGGTGLNAFRFTNNSAVLDGTINGGGSGDFLDYSGYTIPVTVNLATGSATGVDGGKAGGILNIQNVIGGAGNDTLTGDAQGNILIGGSASNVIDGGSGASILMAGSGTATVNGGSGNDILIGGTTSFDSSYSALDSLLAEWQSNKTYSQRISDLKHGGGLNGTNTLVLNTTVLGGGADTLVGKGPNDWFFEFANDTILGFVPGEQIN